MDLQTGRDEQGETVTLRLEGTFDRDAATRLNAQLKGLGQSPVVLDFSLVQNFRDAAIDVLVRGLEGHSFQLRGLAIHQERMFRYLGIGAPPPPRPYYLDA